MVKVIFIREFNALVRSPSAWLLLALIQLILAWVFFMQIETYLQLAPRLSAMSQPPGITDIIVRPLYSNASVILLLLTPLFTLRAFTDEKRHQSLDLLLSAPVTSRAIIGGKYLALALWLSFSCLLVSLMPWSLLLAGTLDIGKWLANLLALLLLTWAFCAGGLAMSCWFRHPISAGLAGFAVLLSLWSIDGFNQSQSQPDPVLEYLSMPGHFQHLQSGLIDSRDIGYFIVVIAGFLTCAMRALEWQRLSP